LSTPEFLQFVEQIRRNIGKTFQYLLEKSEAEEQAAVTKHLQLTGALESIPFKDIDDGKHLPKYQSLQRSFVLVMPRTYRKRDLIKYAILSWFLPEITSWELRETIRARALEKQFWEIGCYTYSLDCCMMALYQEVDLSHSDLFGNILKNNVSWIKTVLDKSLTNEEIKEVKMKRYPVIDFCHIELRTIAKSRPKQRRRGYNDHGSRQPIHRSGLGKYSRDYQLDLLQEQVELRRAQFLLLQRNRINRVLLEGYT